MQTTLQKLVTGKETAAHLSISQRHLHDLTKQRLIPCVRLGRAVRYNPPAVAAAIERNLTQKAIA